MPPTRRPRNSRGWPPRPPRCASPSAPRPISATGSSIRPASSRRADVFAWAPTASPPSVPPRNCAGWNTSSACARSAAPCWPRSTEPHVGTRLWRDSRAARRAGHRPAGGRDRGGPARRLAGAGCRASVHGGRGGGHRLDHLLFAGGDAAIRDVMVAGRWVVKNRRHALEDELRPRFAALMQRLATAS